MTTYTVRTVIEQRIKARFLIYEDAVEFLHHMVVKLGYIEDELEIVECKA